MFPFTIAIGFDLTFGSLLVKTAHIDYIFNAKHLAMRYVSRARLLSLVFSLVALDAVILAIWLATDKPTASLVVCSVCSVCSVCLCVLFELILGLWSQAYPLQQLTVVYACSSSSVAWWYLFIVPKGILLLAGLLPLVFVHVLCLHACRCCCQFSRASCGRAL